jgi:sialic acid synthase
MMNPKIIAEVGCNHMGDLDLAKKFIKNAKSYCNVDVVKFQKRDNKYWSNIKPNQYNSPHPNPENSYGSTYFKHREYLEFSFAQHKELKDYCEEIGIEYSSSVWDLKSAIEITKLNPKIIKIPSACNCNFKMIEYLCLNFMGEIHISTGMTSKIEIEQIVSFFEKHKRNQDIVLYNCVSGYPVPFEDIKLLEISNLIKKYGDRVKDIGFSGHHLGIAVDVAAIALGANFIERHFTLDRTWKGTDHAASLEPDGMRKLVRDIHNVSKSLKYKNIDILPIEEVQRKKLKDLSK